MRARLGRFLRRMAFRCHIWADTVDPHRPRLIEAGRGRRPQPIDLATTPEFAIEEARRNHE